MDIASVGLPEADHKISNAAPHVWLPTADAVQIVVLYAYAAAALAKVAPSDGSGAGSGEGSGLSFGN